MANFHCTLRKFARRLEPWGYDHGKQRTQISLRCLSPRPLQKTAPIKERHTGGAGGESRSVVSNVCRCCPHGGRSGASAFGGDGSTLKGSPLRDSVATVSFGATVVGKMHTAGLKGEPLAAIEPEIRKDWLETLDRAFEAVCTLAGGLSRAMQTLKALESEASYFPVNFPGLGQPVLNLAAEHDQ
jgi:hypothetical protein